MTDFSFITPLFVPAHRPERFEKAAASGTDAVIVDLEDAVAPVDKANARANLRADFGSVPVLIRVNAIGTAWHEDDVAAAVAQRPAAIVVPKAEDTPAFAALVGSLPIPVLALVESALGIAGVRAIAAMPGVARIAFGSWDYCAGMGCEHIEPALLHARSEIVLASRLGGKPAPIDGVTTSFDDPVIIEADARYARSLGFGGKLTIHPKQVAPIRNGFAPSQKDIDWAHKVIASGDAAAAVDGTMVDEPVRIRARAILARAARQS